MAQFPMLHTMGPIRNLKKSIGFNTAFFGLKVLRKTDCPNGKFTQVIIGYGLEETETVLELTHN